MLKTKLLSIFAFTLIIAIKSYSQTNSSKTKNVISIKYEEQIGCLDHIHGRVKIIIKGNKFLIIHKSFSMSISKIANKDFIKAYRGNNSQLIYDLLAELKTNSKLHENEKEKTNHYVNFTIKNGEIEEKLKYEVLNWNGIEIFFDKLKKYEYKKKKKNKKDSK